MNVDLKSWVREVPDHPIPGILFKDVTSILTHPPAFKASLEWFTAQTAALEPDVLAGTDARGFVFAAPVAERLGLPLVLLRKKGKLPPPVVKVEYSLEYADASAMEARSDAITPGQRVAVIDDLLATGGTAVAASKLIENLGGTTVAHIFLIELAYLDGRERLTAHDANCQILANIIYD
ncbi:MAG: adenine phosphoribosyltransferase [Chloroflexi bacterium]|nr:adenine phosphoribosyltransferase [Chloroflexota bacterium]